MCGIAGIFSLDRRRIEDAEGRINRMTMMLKHRGPDSQGVYVSPDGLAALGNTRLSIVDPMCNIEQPLRSADGKAVLSFNGEIYNYLDIKQELISRGAVFRTKMDTEVLLEGLRLKGEDILGRLDGMWSFAYYDPIKRSLLLSRDIMGERHIFYRIDASKSELIFASEVRPILADAQGPLDIDLESMISSLRFYSAPPGRTLIKGILRLRPGHNIIADHEGSLRGRCYKKLHPEKHFDFFKRSPSLDEVIERFEENFYRACKRRLPSDVEFISTLSGGIDSALICAFASDQGKKKIRTLYGQSSAEPPRRGGDKLDEYSASRFTSDKFKTDHIRIHLDDNECVPVLKELAVNGFDGTIDQGAASFQMLARRVRQEGLKVILISDGPDELLGGYQTDKRAYYIDTIAARRPIMFSFLKAISGINGASRLMGPLGQGALYIPKEISYSPFNFMPIHESISTKVLMKVLPGDLLRSVPRHYGVDESIYEDILPYLDYTQKRALSYAATSLPDHFNLRTDKAFLRASVECRLPYQAPEMAEFLIAMPARFRFDEGRTTKYIMRRIVERRIGPEIAYRNKYGFSAPLYKRLSVYREMGFEEVIASSRLFADFPFKPKTKELIFKEKHRKLIWPFYVLARTYDSLKRGIYE